MGDVGGSLSVQSPDEVSGDAGESQEELWIPFQFRNGEVYTSELKTVWFY